MSSSGKIIPRDRIEAQRASGGPELLHALMQSPDEHLRRVFGEAEGQGYRAGAEQGRRDFLKATAEAVAAVREQFFQVEQALGPLVLLATEKILGKLPAEQVAREALSEALTEARAAVAVTLRVAPDDLEFMRSVWSELSEARPELRDAIAAVEGDAGLRPGEMLLETLKGRVHVGVPYQLQRLRYGVLGATA